MTQTRATSDPKLKVEIQRICTYLTERGLKLRKSPLGLVWIVLGEFQDEAGSVFQFKRRLYYRNGSWCTNSEQLQQLITEALEAR